MSVDVISVVSILTYFIFSFSLRDGGDISLFIDLLFAFDFVLLSVSSLPWVCFLLLLPFSANL